jgi:hypothetical protein
VGVKVRLAAEGHRSWAETRYRTQRSRCPDSSGPGAGHSFSNCGYQFTVALPISARSLTRDAVVVERHGQQ